MVPAFGLWILALAPSAEAGIFRHRKVQSVEVGLAAEAARSGELIPGQAVPLTITLVDARGNRRTTRGPLPWTLWRHLEVTVEGGAFDRERGLVVTDAANGRTVDQLEAAGLRLTVTPTRSPSAAVTVERALDWRAVHGPPAEEVASLELEATGAELMDSRWLLPGSELQLVGVVTDLSGRTYRTDDARVRLPWRRLELSTVGLTARGDGQLQASRSRDASPYAVELRLPEAAVEPVRAEWVRDWERIDGPLPEAITDLSMKLVVDAQTPAGELAPGAVTPVVVTATTATGRRFTTARGARLQLPSSRLEVEPQHGQWNADDRTVRWSSQLRSMVGQEYGLSVAYVDRADTRVAASWTPDFLRPLALWRSQGEHRGEPAPAAEGEAGRAGDAGDDGVDARGQRLGEPGQGGQDGAPGAPGTPGPSLLLTAWSTTSLDGRHDVLVYILEGPAGRSVHTVLPGDPRVRITSRGGAGGPGGDGGPGGLGGDGAQGCRAGAGGDGGHGGDGGPGGRGGDGGQIRVFVDHPSTLHRFDLQSLGGAGGDGGAAGRAGDGGLPGAMTDAPAEGGPPACSTASAGSDGRRGTAGTDGADGRSGQVEVRIDRFAVQAATASLPTALRAALP